MLQREVMRLTNIPALIVLLPLFFACSAAKAADPVSVPAAAKAAKEDEMGVVEGFEIARASGGYLGVTTDGVSLVVTFYDDKRKPTPADAVRINARWTDTKLRRAVLLPSGDKSFRSPPVLKPPFRYVAFLVLIGPDDQEMETYSFNLNSVD